VGLHVPEADTPSVLKWEARGDDGGVLKADERFDDEREYVAEGIDARAAVERGVHEHLRRTISDFRCRSETKRIPAERLRVMFNDDHDILDGLGPEPHY